MKEHNLTFKVRLNKLKKFKYINECGIWIDKDDEKIERYIIYTKNNPYLNSLVRYMNIHLTDRKDEFITISDISVRIFRTEHKLHTALKPSFKHWELIDIFKTLTRLSRTWVKPLKIN